MGDGLAKGIDGFVKKFGHRGGCWVGTVEVCTNGNGKGVYKFTRTLLKFFSDFFLRIFDGPFFGVRGNRRQEKRACDRKRPSCMVCLFVKDAKMGLGHSLWVFAWYPLHCQKAFDSLLLFGGQWSHSESSVHLHHILKEAEMAS